MKRKALKSIALFMALNVLFSSTGFALFEHTCHSIGLTSYGFSESDFCEMKTEVVELGDVGLSFSQASCCETHAEFEKINIESGHSFDHIDLPAFVIGSGEKSQYLFINFVNLQDRENYLPLANSPPESSRHRLIRFQTFLI